MPTLEIAIRPRTSPPLETVAWYLPGDVPSCWLDEIAQWPTDHSAIRIIAIRLPDGGSRDQASTAGVVVIPEDARFTPGGQCIAMGRLGENLYLPADAELSPAIESESLRESFAGEYLYAWIPGRGLTAAEPEDVLRLTDLLAIPDDAGFEWDQAIPGVAFPSRLVAVLPDSPPSLDDVIVGGRDGIGERASEIAQLPKTPHEPLSGVTGAIARAAMTGAALPVLGVSKLLSIIASAGSGIGGGARRSGGAPPGTGSKGVSPWLGNLANFANNLLNKAAKSLEAQRHKEIGRLLHMLNSDPDQGLKFAIPFGGASGAHRGLATPGARLSARNVNFNLGNLGGGGAADFWDMSPQYQQQLVTKYRELAAREGRLGRHRRAAYIYAELLGDLRSAASVLEQGRHYREAAVLYREKLNNAVGAAECLERGELWNEAIDAYRDLGRHEKVGDLLVHIGQSQAAAESYHAAADELKDVQDLLGASRIYEEKLGDTRLALETLDSGWPNASQAKRCIAAGYALRARLGRHDEAREHALALSSDARSLHRHADVAEILADVVEQYPEAGVQDDARKLGRDLIASRMRNAGAGESNRLVTALTRLAPSDRLLQRDGRRFVEQRFSGQNQQRSLARTTKRGQLRLIHHYDLGLAGVWRTAVKLGECVVAAGVKEGRIVFARLHPGGRVDRNLTPWPNIPVASETPIVLHAVQSHLRVFAIGEQALPGARVFTASDTGGVVSAATPRGHGVTWGVAFGKTGHAWAIENRDDPALVCVEATGSVVSTQSLLAAIDAPWDLVTHPVPMHATRDQLAIGVGGHLLGVKNSRVELLEALPSRITSLVGGRPYSAPILAASMEVGVALIRLGVEGYVQTFTQDLSEPSVLLNPGGYLIAVDEHTVHVQELKNPKVSGGRTRSAETGHDTARPVAVLPTEKSDQFIIVSERGTVLVYGIDI